MSKAKDQEFGIVSKKELQKFKIFHRLTDIELEKIQDIAIKEEYEAGERVIEEKDKAAKLYLVLEGRVSIKKRGSFGSRELVIDDAIPGEIFAWSAVAEPHFFTAAAVTTEKSIFLTIDGDALRDILERNKEMGYKVMTEIASVISSRFRKVIGQFVSYI